METLDVIHRNSVGGVAGEGVASAEKPVDDGVLERKDVALC